MSLQQTQLPVASSSTRLSISFHGCHFHSRNSLKFSAHSKPAKAFPSFSLNHCHRHHNLSHYHHHYRGQRRQRPIGLVHFGIEDTETRFGDGEVGNGNAATTAVVDEEPEPTPEDLEYISQIKRVLELLRKNRDMLFGEVKLTVMIEDPREIERRRLLGIDDSDAPTRDDLVEALEEVNEGRIPKNRVALRMLAEEITNWPNLEAEVPKKKTKSRSLYAQATDTGIDPEVAAKRLNTDWDSAAEIESAEISDEAEVPPAVGIFLCATVPITPKTCYALFKISAYVIPIFPY